MFFHLLSGDFDLEAIYLAYAFDLVPLVIKCNLI